MKTKLKQHIWYKFIIYVLLVIFSIAFLASIVGIIYLGDQGIYTTTYEDYANSILEDSIVGYYYDGDLDEYEDEEDSEENPDESEQMQENKEAPKEDESKEIEAVKIDVDEDLLSEIKTYIVDINQYEENKSAPSEISSVEMENGSKIVYQYSDTVDSELRILRLEYQHKYIIIGWAIITLIISSALYVALMCSAGYRVGFEGPQPGPDAKIWFDIETIFFLAIDIFGAYIVGAVFVDYTDVVSLLILTGYFVGAEIIFIGWSMSFASRVKQGKWWETTFIYQIIVKGFILLFKLIKNTFSRLPFVWKSTLIFLAFVGINLLASLSIYEEEYLCLWYAIQVVLWLPILVYFIFQLKKLRIAGDELAKGNLEYKVEADSMFLDLKKHAENLNSISKGMTNAVEERMKSERMKTELISNVSHDIKTPLTSIINYTDLISKEECDNDKIKEYTEVLHRNSERLKRLMEDIIEASKASSGAIDVNLEPLEAGILLTQIAGEYEEKFEEKKLSLILKQPEENICILADTRRLWRVFDNLFNNIYKYSQENTRVYTTLSKENDRVIFVFKNTSATELDIAAEELMERFVRADASRNTEGNGLGLNIARSLTELQDGTFDVSVDGDLFKVTITFPLIESDL